jgi:hypothetical protein
MSSLAMFSMTGTQSFVMEHSYNMESYWTRLSSSFRASNISQSNARNKKDDDNDGDASMKYIRDDSSLSDDCSDSGAHPVHKSNIATSSPQLLDMTLDGRHRNLHDLIDDQNNHPIASLNLVSNAEVATTYMDDRNQEVKSPQEHTLLEKTDDSTSSNGSSGSPTSVFMSKKSASRMLTVTTKRLTERSKLKSE